MSTSFLRMAFGWGVGLWFIGYVLGFLLFPFVPASLLGWVISPIGIVITVWVLWKRAAFDSLKKYIFLGTIWAALAVVLDYFFLLQLLKPADGYYKLDVYLYYVLTFLLPIVVGWLRIQKTYHLTV